MSNQKGHTPLFLILITLIVLGIIVGSYLMISKLGNTAEKTETITIQDDLSFKVLVPRGYFLQKIGGDGLVEILSSDEKNSVLFNKSTEGGERGMAVPYMVDNTSFEIEYSKTLTCPAHLSAPNTKFYEGAFTSSLYFVISIKCKDDTQQDNKAFEKIISSIRFSPHLRRVLMGEEQSPLLKELGLTHKDIDIANEAKKGIISQGVINEFWKMYTGPTDNQNGKFSVEFPSEWITDNTKRRNLYLPDLDKQKYYVWIGTASKLYPNGQNGKNCQIKTFSAGSFEFCTKKDADSIKIIATLSNKDYPYKGAPYYAFLISYPPELDTQYKSILEDIVKTVKRIE